MEHTLPYQHKLTMQNGAPQWQAARCIETVFLKQKMPAGPYLHANVSVRDHYSDMNTKGLLQEGHRTVRPDPIPHPPGVVHQSSSALPSYPP
jgi:hypothetical protein